MHVLGLQPSLEPAKLPFELAFGTTGANAAEILRMAQALFAVAYGQHVRGEGPRLLLGDASVPTTAPRLASYLADENQRLSDELDLMERRLVLLTDTVEVLTRRDEELRLLAGLPPTDPAVLEAGIGGPSGDAYLSARCPRAGHGGKRYTYPS